MDLDSAPGCLKFGLRFKPSGMGGKPAEARDKNPLATTPDANPPATVSARTSWTPLGNPLGNPVDRPKPSAICGVEALEADIARKCYCERAKYGRSKC